jgi:hypothetical protein
VEFAPRVDRIVRVGLVAMRSPSLKGFLDVRVTHINQVIHGGRGGPEAKL